jgi:DNA excision repair protein ERCC-2
MDAGGEGYMRFFPYEEFYPNQAAAMGRIDDALGAGRDVLFEGPCGTGKTLAALVPALDHARTTDRTVVITTNVHQQMRQFVADASAITAAEPIRAVVFRGKASMCHVDVGVEECRALRETTRTLVDHEREQATLERRQRELLEEARAGSDEAAAARADLLTELDDLEEDVASLREEGATCDHYYRNLTADTAEFLSWLFEDVRTPDAVYDYADERGQCGYELLKESMEGVDLAVCNYHHLLNPEIRAQFVRWLGRDPEDVVAVFDEAHNLEAAAREHARRTLAEPTLEAALAELDDEPPAGSAAPAAANVIATFRDALVATYEDAVGVVTGGREVGADGDDVSIDNDDRRDDLTLAFLDRYSGQGVRGDVEAARDVGAALDERYERAFKRGETPTRQESATLTAADFLETWMDAAADDEHYPVVGVRRADGGEVYGRAELATVIPSRVTARLFDDLHATVLMSATLCPFDVTRSVLGLGEVETMAFENPFPKERRRTFAVAAPALFASKRDDPDVVGTVADALAGVVRATPGNTLAFFPSYAEAERYHDRLAVDGATFLDRPGRQARDLRESFVAADDAVLCTSLWGTLGEGVSYDGDDARSVVVVGVPYPHLDDRMAAIQAAYDEAFDAEDAGWRYAVEIPTIRKTRQALGRVVRSPEDFGARVLLDGRYTRDAELELREYAVRGAFPPAERREMIDVAPEKLPYAMVNFFQAMDAYDGDPPVL